MESIEHEFVIGAHITMWLVPSFLIGWRLIQEGACCTEHLQHVGNTGALTAVQRETT